MTLPTVDDLQQTARTAIQSRRDSLTDFETGSVLDAITYSGAILAQEIQAYAAQLFAKLFFSTEDSDALNALVVDRFGGNLKPQLATAAIGTLTFRRASGGAPVLISAGTVCAPESAPELTFVTTEDRLLSDLEIDCPATCTVTGGVGNVAAGQITLLVTPPMTGLMVVNVERFVGGAEAETLVQLRARIQLYYQNLSRGVAAALQLGALSVDGVRVAVVDETHIAPDDGGYVELLVGDSDGYSNTELVTAVEAIMVNWRAAGVLVVITGVSRLELGAQLILTLTSEAALGRVADDVRAALEAYGKTLAAGQTIYLSQLERVAINVSPYEQGGVILDADAMLTLQGETLEGDHPVARAQVPRLVLDLITVAGVVNE